MSERVPAWQVDYWRKRALDAEREASLLRRQRALSSSVVATNKDTA